MCCIFTCCGWMIDLVQRLWTFTMSCCISSAVCCALATASMSGIALGYNYSLAEYIDLKETNVSVYLKRGVFDDEIADDMDWRRSGHMPVEGHLRDSNLMTGAPDNEEMPMRPGRRMDDSLVVSDDQQKFEGSLMRLTVKPPAYKSSIQPVTSDLKMAEVLAQYPKGSLEQMKAIHGLLNQRRANTQKSSKMPEAPNQLPMDFNGRRVGGIAPGGIPFHDTYSNDALYNINPARLAVPDPSIGHPENWLLANKKQPESYMRTMDVEDYANNPLKPFTRPRPIIFTSDMQRPTRPLPTVRPTKTPRILKEILREDQDPDLIKQVPDDEIQMFKNQLLQDKKNFERLQNERLRKYGDKTFQSEEDYAEQAYKGVPVRKKRQRRQVKDLIKPKYSARAQNSVHAQDNDVISKNLGSTSTYKENSVTIYKTSKGLVVDDDNTRKQNNSNETKITSTPAITIIDDNYTSRKVNERPIVSSDEGNTIIESVLVTKLYSIKDETMPKLESNLNFSTPSTDMLKLLVSSLSVNL